MATKKPKRGNRENLVLFKKGERRVGRAKGTKNKFTRQIKEAIIEAIEQSGRDGKGKDGAVGYFVWLLRAEPAVFGGLIAKVMPTQVEIRDKAERTLTVQEAVEKLRERGLPVPPSLIDLTAVDVSSMTLMDETETDEIEDENKESEVLND